MTPMTILTSNGQEQQIMNDKEMRDVPMDVMNFFLLKEPCYKLIRKEKTVNVNENIYKH